MASTSHSASPSNIRRLRAARLNFEPPSFSLGIEIESVNAIPSFDTRSEPSFSLGLESENVRAIPSFDTKLEPSLVEEEKSLKAEEQGYILIDEEDGEDGLTSGGEQRRRFKRLKRGPPLAGKEPLQEDHGAGRLFSIPDASAVSSSKDRSEFSPQLHKEPLSFVKDISSKEPDAVSVTGIDASGYGQAYVQTGNGDPVLPNGSDHTRGLNQLTRGPSSASGVSRDSLSSGDVSQFRGLRDQDSNGRRLSLNNRETRTPEGSFRIQRSEIVEVSSDGDVDEIEEFSDNELTRSGTFSAVFEGSQTQGDRKSLRPLMVATSPILLTSSPETFQKPILHIPGLDFQPKVPSGKAPTTDVEMPGSEDDSWLDEFQSGPDWWRRPTHAPQQPKNISSNRSLPKTSQRETSREIPFRSFETETPVRRDIVGPSQAFRNADVNVTEENQIPAFLRNRFPHFKPVDALLVDGGLDNEPVYIDYRRQFSDGTGNIQLQSGNAKPGNRRWPAVRSIEGAFSESPPISNANQGGKIGKKKVAAKSQPKKRQPGNARAGKLGRGGSGEGKWRTVNGSRVYIVGGDQMSGQRAYVAYKRGSSSKKKSKNRRPPTKSE